MNPIRKLSTMIGVAIFACWITTNSFAAPVWEAQWIGPGQAGTNTWIAYRKTVNITNTPASVTARIAVDSKYWLWINGKQIVFEGGLKRGPSPTNTYYDEIEIGPALNDKKTMQDVYPQVRDYLKVWKLDSNELVIHRKGDWDWEDWGENIDATVLDSAWYHLALEGAVNMAKLCAQEQDIPEWQSRLKAIEGGFNAKFWTGKEYRSSNYKGDTDDRANAMAVVSGLAGADKYDALREVFAKHRNASPYMEKYVIEALYLMNTPDQAMARMRERWKVQIAAWTSTLWEGWGLGAEGYGGGTYNHAWSGGALTALSQYADGVAPDAPAFERYHVLPQMGALKLISATVPTPRGNIQVELKDQEKQFQFKITSPQGTTATIGIPVKNGRQTKKLEINGKLTWSSDGENNPVPGVSFESVDPTLLADTNLLQWRVAEKKKWF